MTINIIVAASRDGAIGVDGDMPFHISADLKRFKALTMGYPIIMGRKTFQSLPGGALPGRRNIVVTRNPQFKAQDAESASSLHEALEMCSADEEIFIIGGGEIYRQAIPLADRIYLTEIDHLYPEADTHFPLTMIKDWIVSEDSPEHTDARSSLKYKFRTFLKAKP